MPIMPRMNNKSKKIAYEILGKPANMTDKKKNSRREYQLEYEDSVKTR